MVYTCYSGADGGQGVSASESARRLRIVSENAVTTVSSGNRGDQLFAMNKNGAISFGGNNWPISDRIGAEDYGTDGEVLKSQGADKPPIWATATTGSSTINSPVSLLPVQSGTTSGDVEGSSIVLKRTSDSADAIELDVYGAGNTGDYNFRIVDKINNTERLRISKLGAWGLSGFAAYGLTGQVLMSRGNGAATTWSHKPAISAWWNGSKETVSTIDTVGVMEIGRYLDFHISINSGNDYDARIENTGNLALTVSNTISNTSDRRIKENFNVISSPLDKVGIITGYTFNYTNTEEKTPSAGLIAQDVEKILPDLVSENDEEIKSLNYNGITALLVEAVKELKAKNTALEARIAALESS